MIYGKKIIGVVRPFRDTSDPVTTVDRHRVIFYIPEWLMYVFRICLEKEIQEMKLLKKSNKTSARIIRVTAEVTARVNIYRTGSGKLRGDYTLYAPPTTRQKTENKFGLGSPFGPAVRGESRETREEVIEEVEEMICSNATLRKQYHERYDQLYPENDVSVKAFLLRYWTEITAQPSCSKNLLKKYFFSRESFVEAMCDLHISDCTPDAIHCLAQDLMRDGYTEDEVISMLRQLKFIFRYAKNEGLYDVNPVNKALGAYTEYQNLMRELRNALVLRSLSNEENMRLLKILREHMKTEPGLMIGCMIRWLTGMYSREVAPLVWGDIVMIERVNIYQILVYKEFPSKSTTIREMTYDDLYRVVPVCLLLREALEEYRNKLRERLDDLSDDEFLKIPVVATIAEPTLHITPEMLTRFCNDIRNELAIEKRMLTVTNSRKERLTIDLSRSQGDWLRTNYDYHARRVVAILDDVNYAMGRRLKTTLASHYRDYTKPERQLAYSVSIDRWAETMREECFGVDTTLHTMQIDMEERTILFRKACVPTMHQIRIRVPKGTSEEKLRMYVFNRFGGTVVAYRE